MDTSTDDTTPTTPRIETLIAHYSESHLNAVNEAIHCVCVPLIMFSLVGLIYAAHPAAAALFLLASLVYYARLSWRAFALMAVWSVGLLALISALEAHLLAICGTVFVMA